MTTTASSQIKLQRAIERQLKGADGWAWDADNQCGVFNGRFNTATIQAHATGFAVDVQHVAGQSILNGDYKTLGAALRNGSMFANSNYSRS